MTEAEWLACSNPTPMLEYLQRTGGQRKLRLFACACCRRIWNTITDEQCRAAVETAERYTDGLASDGELLDATRVASRAHFDVDGYASTELGTGADAAWTAAEYASCLKNTGLPTSIWHAAAAAARLVGGAPPAGEKGQARLLRDIFGNPFRPVAFSPALRTATVTSLADAIYAERAFDRLPILADALEDAGCTERAILEHCRRRGEHVRGCWVVDLVLGKE